MAAVSGRAVCMDLRPCNTICCSSVGGGRRGWLPSVRRPLRRSLRSEPGSRVLRAGRRCRVTEAGVASVEEAEDVADSVELLKQAAKTRKVPCREVFAAIRKVEKAKLDPSDFLKYIGGTESPGRTWMLVFTAGRKVVREALKGGPGGGQYVPITAVQNFDAADMRIQNGVYLGPVGSLTLQGKFWWKKGVLAFIFLSMGLKIGQLGPFTFRIAKSEDAEREASQKDPFFIWFYADDEIIVAKGVGGGVAYWCRCERVTP